MDSWTHKVRKWCKIHCECWCLPRLKALCLKENGIGCSARSLDYTKFPAHIMQLMSSRFMDPSLYKSGKALPVSQVFGEVVWTVSCDGFEGVIGVGSMNAGTTKTKSLVRRPHARMDVFNVKQFWPGIYCSNFYESLCMHSLPAVSIRQWSMKNKLGKGQEKCARTEWANCMRM